MPVTELAILQVPETNLPFSSQLLDRLAHAKAAMEEFSGYKFFYYHCKEDPTIIYIIGCWPSVDFHMQEWIPSKENQDLLTLLGGQLTVDAMFHIGIDQTLTPVPTTADVLAVERHYIKPGKRSDFEETFKNVGHHLDAFTEEKWAGAGAFRIDRDKDTDGREKDEFVLLTGWDSVERHSEFAKAQGFQEYSKIREYLEGADIKHATLLKVGTTQ